MVRNGFGSVPYPVQVLPWVVYGLPYPSSWTDSDLI